MRDRPFIAANEPPRPFSEVVAERRLENAGAYAWSEIRRLEGAAAAATDPAERKRLQCEAEGWRCALHEQQEGDRR